MELTNSSLTAFVFGRFLLELQSRQREHRRARLDHLPVKVLNHIGNHHLISFRPQTCSGLLRHVTKNSESACDLSALTALWVTVNTIRRPLSCILPADCIEVSWWPQSSQLNDDRTTSRKKGIFVNKSRVTP